MARVAVHRGIGVVPVQVALRTGQRGMHAGQRIAGVRRMVESRVRPTDGGMADRAIRRETRGGVRRIVGPVEIGFVAAIAVCRKRCVVVAGVALPANHRNVGASQGKTCLGVIKAGRTPPARGVTVRATGRKPRAHVIGIRCGNKIRLVTGIAIGRRIYVLIVGVALHAGQRGVHAGQRIPRKCRVIELRIEPVARGVAHPAVVGQIGLHVRRIV